MKIKKLSGKGFSHGIIAVAFLVVFSIIGIGYPATSRAATIGRPICGSKQIVLNGKCVTCPFNNQHPNANKSSCVCDQGYKFHLSGGCTKIPAPKPVPTNTSGTQHTGSTGAAVTSNASATGTAHAAPLSPVVSKPLCKTRTFKAGVKGKCTSSMQVILNSTDMGKTRNVKATGNFGAATKNKVISFQTRYPSIGSTSGIVGPNTWAKLCEKGNNAYNSPDSFKPDTFNSVTLRHALEYTGCR